MGERERRLSAARTRILEENLTLKCPRCKQAFFDFQGCTALDCSRCSCKFCGWCLHDCGDKDAHPHVANCDVKPPECDVFYPRPLERFNRHWRERKAMLVRQTLNEMLHDDAERAEVREALREHLQEFAHLL
uniref:RING-type domain-containing protein n=1 Tax=Haptolina ericina TaxID=156174 RepID=A0A7S3AK67_9EUKA|mmetsp:Transcript_21582/g.48602  ORF Transcript_21582/g.48602 Transcript_21582/m.48602 type:complete len:132 (+) Transcript_21582:3-398(+)